VTATLSSLSPLGPAGGRYDASRVVEREVWKNAPISKSEPAASSPTETFPARLSDVTETVRLIPVGLVILWSMYAAFVLGRVAFATRRARGSLGPRRIVADRELAERFNRVAERLGVRNAPTLTLSGEMNSPVALGRTEICLPERIVTELRPDEQESVIAHEIAHVVRRDPLWLLAAVTVESILFFQPLNRVARMHIQEEAEFLADDLAVARASSSLTLARCLARVAEWMTSSRELLAPAFVEQKSSLAARVKRLLESASEHSSARHASVVRVAVALVLPVIVLVVAPGFTAGGNRPWGTAAFHWEGAVAAGKSVEIKGAMGNIRAQPSDENTVVVNATRHGRATVPDVQFALVRHDEGITICTIYPVPAGVEPNTCEHGGRVREYNTKANDVEIEYLVRLPKGVGFIARTATGDVSSGRLSAPVFASSSAGKIDIETKSFASASTLAGNITVRMGATDWRETLSIASNAGNIRVYLPPAAATTVHAGSGLGSVSSDFPLSGERPGFFARLKPRGSFGSSLSGVLGDGGASAGAPRMLDLQSVAGNISIKRGN
jgi:beta-lactamase regulating signal transducer with metallopeptidase domain